MIVGVGAAAGQSEGGYTFITIDPPGSTLTDARGINDAGQMAKFLSTALGLHFAQ
jgi:hypothetical protein